MKAAPFFFRLSIFSWYFQIHKYYMKDNKYYLHMGQQIWNDFGLTHKWTYELSINGSNWRFL